MDKEPKEYLKDISFVPTEAELSDAVKRVIFGLAGICEKGYKEDLLKCLASMLNAAAVHQHSQLLFSNSDRTANISFLLRQEYGFCNACTFTDCDPENPPCKDENLLPGTCAKEEYKHPPLTAEQLFKSTGSTPEELDKLQKEAN